MLDCDECRKLWSDYSVATNEHIRLKGKLDLATLSHDREAAGALTPLVAEAGEKRKSLRGALETHRRTVHESADAADAGS